MKTNSFFRISIGLLFLVGSIFVTAEEREGLTLEQIRILQELSPGEETADETEANYQEFLTFKEDETRREECERRKLEGNEECIFGYTIFSSIPSTYALSSNVPVPPSYMLGPGDELSIEYYGNGQINYGTDYY